MITFAEALRSTYGNYQSSSKPIPVIKRHTLKQKLYCLAESSHGFQCGG